MPTKNKKKGGRGQGVATPHTLHPTPRPSASSHTEQYRFEDDLSIPHPRQPRILRYVSLSTGRSEYINGEIFGERAEVPKTISITVEW